MHGMIQDWPLTVDKIIDHAASVYPDREIVTRAVEGGIHRTHYSEIRARAKQVSAALLDDGIEKGDIIATLAWNTWRHMEVWYGAMGIGAVVHTVNPRLHPSQIAWLLNDAEDKVLFVDTTFLPLIEAIKDKIPTIKRIVILTGPDDMPQTSLNAMSYELYIDGRRENVAWGNFDENTPCGLCYTSGTTGKPKGVTYTHRSNVLHTLMSFPPDLLGAHARDVMLPVVPMFHANAWGLAFTCPALGNKMVMPGAQMDGASIYELLDSEKVTLTAAVPTVWLMLLKHLQENNRKLPYLRKVLIGGAAVPEKILRVFEDEYDVEVVHAWGMTETSPVGTQGALPPELVNAPRDAQISYKLKQGRPPFGVELCLKKEGSNTRLPHDGRTSGRLMVKGLAVVDKYFKGVGGNILDEEGWFDTGDVATLDRNCTMQITDRAKDVIKSGGEWISSIDIENFAVGHEDVANAAAIGIPHPKWDERPLLIIQPVKGRNPSIESILASLEGKIAKWWTPDAVEFMEDIPLGATGKIDKKKLREIFKDYTLPNVDPA